MLLRFHSVEWKLYSPLSVARLNPVATTPVADTMRPSRTTSAEVDGEQDSAVDMSHARLFWWLGGSAESRKGASLNTSPINCM